MKIIMASKPAAMFALACLAWGRPAYLSVNMTF
jgi:hypothetical protein